jgi:outer membrane protein assembly factor BamD
MTDQALHVFEKLVRTYPDTVYAKRALDHIRVCNKNLAEHELYVGMFYYKSKHYKAALERFKTVLSSYPDLGVHRQALEYIPLCQAKLGEAEPSTD